MKTKIEYPCEWIYKIIGADMEELKKAVSEAAGDRPYSLEHSRSSKTGSYLCLNLKMTLHSNKSRLEIHEALKHKPSVILIL